MLLCHCHRVSDAAVAEAAQAASRIGHVVRATRAGTDCGSCIPVLRSACEQLFRDRAEAPVAASA